MQDRHIQVPKVDLGRQAIFSQPHFCLQAFIKIAKLLLATLSINGLKKTTIRIYTHNSSVKQVLSITSSTLLV